MGLVLLIAICQILLQGPSSSANETIAVVGRSRQLFFDDDQIAAQSNVRKVWHRPRKMPHPVLEKAASWEGSGPYLFGTVWRDHQSGSWKMWYNCYVGGQPDYFVCHATSRDGLAWSRPSFDVVHDPRLPKGNNAVMLGSGRDNSRQCLSPTVFERPDEADPARRYAMIFWDTNAGATIQYLGLCLAFSPDGIHWTNHPRNPVFSGSSDVVDCCYDPVRKRYLAHFKIWRVEGAVVDSETSQGKVGTVSYWPTFDTKSLDGGKVRFTGQVTDYEATDTSPHSGWVEFARPPSQRRAVARAESADLIHWTDARLCFALPEADDPSDLTTYGMSVYPYEGRYVGLLRIMRGARDIDLELAYSRDDVRWKRTTPGAPFIARGFAGSFDAGMVFSSNQLVEVDNELRFYYGAFNGDHEADDNKQKAVIGLATLRKDGFVSWNADAQTGELVTVPLRCDGNRLRINAAAKNGSIQVELRDALGKPVTGYSFGDCDTFHTDDISHEVCWRGSPNLGQLQGQSAQIAFRLKDAALYAYQFDLAERK